MKSTVYVIFAALALITSLSGCSAVPQESALEWMTRQPWDTLP